MAFNRELVDACESSWKWVHLSRPVDDGELGKLVLAEAKDYHEAKHSALVSARCQGQQSVHPYLRIDYILLMTNNTSCYRQADVKRIQSGFTNIGVFD